MYQLAEDIVNSVSMENLAELTSSAAQIVESTEARDRLIVEARLDGWPWASIAEAAKMTPAGVQKAATRANGGVLPVPRQRQPQN